MFEEVRKAFGRVDVLVNNAGVYAPAPIESLSVSEFNRHFDTNVLGLLLATKAALPLFPATGGSIVNISSVVSTLAPAAAAIYVGTKGAVDSITKSLAKEFAPRKIRVNGVSPGFVITEGTHSAGMAGGEFEAWAVANTPLGRAGQPEDIAAAVAFLASDDASLDHRRVTAGGWWQRECSSEAGCGGGSRRRRGGSRLLVACHSTDGFCCKWRRDRTAGSRVGTSRPR